MPGNDIELNGVNDGLPVGIDMLSPFQSHRIKLPIICLMDVRACFGGVWQIVKIPLISMISLYIFPE